MIFIILLVFIYKIVKLKFAMVRLEIIVFTNGERYPILIENGKNIPHYYSTLWTTSILRSSCSVNTIRNKLYAIRWLFKWEYSNNRNIVNEFKNGNLLSYKDMINLREHFRLSEKTDKKKLSFSNRLSGNKKSINSIIISHSHQYNRMTAAIEYLEFISSLFMNKGLYTPKDVEKMTFTFKNLRPNIRSFYSSEIFDNASITDGLLDEFLGIADYLNPKNPFKNEGIRKRNYLMFMLLRKLGIRRGELLSIRVDDLILTGNHPAIFIRRTHDDPIDSRMNQAVAKTKERRLVISLELSNLIDEYILNYRNKIPNSNRHPYLFVTHKKGISQGKPLSISSFDNIIIPTMKKVDKKFSIIHSHIFRHEWNLDFSRKVDLNNKLAKENKTNHTEITPENEAKYRQHWMGHTSEKSSYIYNKRHIIEQANKLVLLEQEELLGKLSNKIVERND